jgi:hypothetical protein
LSITYFEPTNYQKDKRRGRGVDLMDALKKSLAEKRSQKTEADLDGRTDDRAILTYSEFKGRFEPLGIAASSVRKSYAGLVTFRKRKNISWHKIRNLVHHLGSKIESQMVPGKSKLKAVWIPLTDRDWERTYTLPKIATRNA